MSDFKVEIAVPEDHKTLSSIAVESKKYWKYPADWIRGWLPELNVTADYIRENTVLKLIGTGWKEICGFCAIEWFRAGKEEAEIAHLWILPKYIGKGMGSILLRAALDKIREQGVTKVRVTADPNARSFYEKFGFVIESQIESTPKGRYLPHLILEML